MSVGVIYKSTNKINGKSYIGKTIQDFDRYIQFHLSDARTNRYPNRVFHRAIRKYGEDNFEWNIIEQVNNDKLNEREIYYINLFDTFENGYNMTTGGDGAECGENNAFCKLSSEKRMKIILKGNKKRKQHRHSDETKNKMTKIRLKMYKGRNNPLAKVWILYSPKGKEYIVKDGLDNFCKKMNLSLGLLRKNINNDAIQNCRVKGKRTNKTDNTVGWRISCQ